MKKPCRGGASLPQRAAAFADSAVIREHLSTTYLGHEAGFRRRGTEVNRIEAFSDAVFGFALTLLVVSMEVPHTFAELKQTMHGFFPFALCFAWLLTIWFHHYRFFRRYGLEDKTTLVLNALLLFVVLFYIYPLKFLFSFLLLQFFGEHPPRLSGPDVVQLMSIYGAGFFGVYVALGLMYLHAFRRREELDLDAAERLYTISNARTALLTASVGLVSICIVRLGGWRYAGLAGWSYCSVALLSMANGWWLGVKLRRVGTSR